MAESNGDSLPSYSVTQIGSDAVQQTEHYKGRQSATDNHRIMGKQNASNSFSGFIDIMYKKEKLPWSCAKNMIYKVGLFVYFFANVVYSTVAFAIQKEYLAFHLAYIIISLTGFVFQLFVIIAHVKEQCTASSDTEEETTLLDSTCGVTHINQPQETDIATERVRDYPRKAKRVIVDYVLRSLGEFLIYPTLICTLYGFINERAWKFNNTTSECYSVFFFCSVIVEAIYMKFYVTFLVIRIARAAYKKYDHLLPPTEMEWKRYFTPVYLTIPFTVLTALAHWFMIGIIGVRIYIDNFTPDEDDTNSSIPDTGDYRVTLLTGYMIGCTVYLPIVSWIAYIILNKLWFYEVFSAINQMTAGADHMPPRNTWNKKLLAFIKDPLSYVVAVLLMIPFIMFIAGAYPLDYEISDYEVSSSARNTIQQLGLCFIVFFVLSNLQAVIIFTISLVVVVVLCVMACYKNYHK